MSLKIEMDEIKEQLKESNGLFLSIAKAVGKMDDVNLAGGCSIPYKRKAQVVRMVVELGSFLKQGFNKAFLELGYSEKEAMEKAHGLVLSLTTY